MDFLKIFSRDVPTAPMALPSGTFTIDRTGRLVTSTISTDFPEKLALEIGRAVLDTFLKAKAAEVVMTELTITFAAVKLTARELRGGAIVFLAPRDASNT
jgi:molybdopterin-binding protein